MSELVDRLANLNPFSRAPREDDEDQGEQVDETTVAGGGHHTSSSNLRPEDLRVSHALKSFLVAHRVMSEDQVGLDHGDTVTEALYQLLLKPHAVVPPELTDRSHPLPAYFISSSHNTYLLAHQLYGQSCASGYRTAIKTGSRCVEIDAWDNDDDWDEPKVTHGWTLTSNIPFRDVCQTIADCVDEEAVEAASTPGSIPSPIFISLENHCGPKGQLRLVEIMRQVFGHRLLDSAVREEGHREQEGTGGHVTLAELGAKIAVIVEYHLPEEATDSDSSSDDEADAPEEKEARLAYKQKKTETKTSTAVIIPELADLGIYAQSVKPVDTTWLEGELLNGPHHHLVNVSETGLRKHMVGDNKAAIARHNSQHLMRVFPKGTRIGSSNLRPSAYWAVGAQIAALNTQHFGVSNQLNHALFSGTDGYVLKPTNLRYGNAFTTEEPLRKKRLRLHVGGASDVPLHDDSEADSIRPYVTCTLFHPDTDLESGPTKRKTAPYKQHKLGFLHRGENPPPTDPVWDEILEWVYDPDELVFVRMLIKSDESWSRNPMFACVAVRVEYLQLGEWVFVQMLDLAGHETKCFLLVKFEVDDA